MDDTELHDALRSPEVVAEMAKLCEEEGLVFANQDELLEFLNEVLLFGTEDGEFVLDGSDDYDDADDLPEGKLKPKGKSKGNDDLTPEEVEELEAYFKSLDKDDGK